MTPAWTGPKPLADIFKDAQDHALSAHDRLIAELRDGTHTMSALKALDDVLTDPITEGKCERALSILRKENT